MRMTASAADQIRCLLSDGARAGSQRGKTSLFNLISLIKRDKAYLAENKLTVPTRLHNSVAKTVLKSKMLLYHCPPVPKEEALANRTGS